MRTNGGCCASDLCDWKEHARSSRSDDKLGGDQSLSCSHKGGSIGLEDGSKGLGRGALTSIGDGETHALVGETNLVDSSELGVLQHGGTDDLDGLSSAGVLTGEVNVELGDSVAKSVGSEFLVHVDGVGTGQVSEKDAVVLDVVGILLEDLAGGDDLTLDLADLVLTLHVVPELGPGEDLVACEHAHSEKLGVGHLISWQSSADDVKLSDLFNATV